MFSFQHSSRKWMIIALIILLLLMLLNIFPRLLLLRSKFLTKASARDYIDLKKHVAGDLEMGLGGEQ